MKNKLAILKLTVGFCMAALAVQGAVILDTTTALTTGDSIQLGRLSRNGVPQDWTGTEAFPGAINATTSYYYTTLSVNVGAFSYIQVDVDSVSANMFASAYLGSYLPDSAGSPNFGFDTNWLGDPGSSGNYFGTDPLFFQVLVPVNGNLLIVLNNTGADNAGVGDSVHITVEGFYDSSFDDTPPVPEPSTAFMLMGGLSVLGFGMFRRKK